jgi:hypothetical protein
MSEIVFILGAGASSEAGAPLMKNFLSRADQLRRELRTGPYADDFKRVDDAISELTRVHSKAQLNLDDLEEVFGAFEMAKVIQRFPGLPSEDVYNLVNSQKIDESLRSFRNVITCTLEESIEYLLVNGKLEAPASYARFANLLRHLQTPSQMCTVITFNYDTALDLALYNAGIGIDYGLSDRRSNVMPYLKLHGSLNWFPTRYPPIKVKPWYFSDFFRPIRSYETTANPAQLRLSQHVAQEQPFVNEQVDPTPVIVPPTWNKTAYQEAIASVWSRAAAELSNAERVFISGYSLIATDSYFKYLFALGSVGPSRIREFAVYDPDPQVEQRFKSLLGPGVRGFHFATNPFSGFIDLVADQLGVRVTAR